jgi:hypothetical protein
VPVPVPVPGECNRELNYRADRLDIAASRVASM